MAQKRHSTARSSGSLIVLRRNSVASVTPHRPRALKRATRKADRVRGIPLPKTRFSAFAPYTFVESSLRFFRASFIFHRVLSPRLSCISQDGVSLAGNAMPRRSLEKQPPVKKLQGEGSVNLAQSLFACATAKTFKNENASVPLN